MPRTPFRTTDRLLPLFLALPAGTIAGLPSWHLPRHDQLRSCLARLGPCLRTEAALRHAAVRPPPQAVVELEPAATVASDTALSLLAGAGTVVLLLSPDLGTLTRLCDRILVNGTDVPGWVESAALRAGRTLCLRVERGATEEWLRLSLGGDGAEGVLAGCRARGLVVLESRVDYGWAEAR